MARLAERHAARRVPAGSVRRLRGHLSLVGGRWCRDGAHVATLRARRPVPARGLVGRISTLWKDRRRTLSQERAGAAAVLGPVADHLSRAIARPVRLAALPQAALRARTNARKSSSRNSITDASA